MNIRWFSSLSKNDASIAGGKGASLGEMYNAKIPVPNGFVVTTHAFTQFLHEQDLTQEISSILSTVDTHVIHTVEQASEKIQGLILQAEMSTTFVAELIEQYNALGAAFVAIRSSATSEDGAEHAWAGQLNTYLNVTKDNVVPQVQLC